jgi:uncharacterized membrane protein (DUF4010 family)
VPSANAVPFLDFAIALFIGALVGIEREKRQTEQLENGGVQQRGTGGLRTFILFAEAGALAAWLSLELATWAIFVASGVGVTAVVLAGYAAASRQPGQLGLTTEVAALVTYLLGGAVIFGHAELAVALAIVTSAVLAFRDPLHSAVGKLGRDDLYAGLKLLIATFIVLPVLPDRTLDPWQALNPWRMWWLVILISGLSLVGYVATRALDTQRGIPLTGLFGGLVSSTAVTLSLARRSREDAGGMPLADALAAGILLAWATMFARIGVVLAALDVGLLRRLAPLLAVWMAIAAGFAAWHHHRGRAASPSGDDVPLRNPFSLTAAMRFALLFATVLLVVRWVELYLPGVGLYAVAALAGATDVDPITLSMASATREVAAAPAAAAIAIAAASNTLVKCGLVAALGAPALRRHVLVSTGALLGAGALVLFVGL